ncbi:MAG: hypothetical protein R3Y24_06775 [Eubacteriales bacterium]
MCLQIAYRLGKMLELSTIYAIDDDTPIEMNISSNELNDKINIVRR